jgi:crotonobetainyl-CoA:carnitine CoA-transferase CaiB-like acyl-CoA transferase
MEGFTEVRQEDVQVVIAVNSDEEWARFCEVTGNGQWRGDVRFADALSRCKNQDELDRLIGEWTKNHDQYEVMEMLQKAGVMAGASLSPKELVSDPQLRERGFFVDFEHPEMSKLTLAGLPWKLSSTPKGKYLRPALLGEHNNYVFGKLLETSE